MRFAKYLLAVLALVGAAAAQAPAGSTQLFSDDCTRSNASTLGASYTVIYGTWSIGSNRCYLSTAGGHMSPVWINAASFGAGQYSAVKRNQWVTSDYLGPAVRIPAGTANGYMVACVAGTAGSCTSLELDKVTGTGSKAALTSFGGAFAAGGELAISVTGSNPAVLQVWWNGSSLGSYSDSSSPITSGSPGLMGYTTTPSSTYGLTYIEAGNMGTTVATPTFSPAAGTYPAVQTVTISDSTSGATVCYTADGSTPTTNGAGGCVNGAAYSGPVQVGQVGQTSTVTLQAVGTKSGSGDSSVASAAYVIQYAQAPTAAPAAGGYFSQQTVTLADGLSGAVVCYTTDGSTPATNGAGVCSSGSAYAGGFQTAASGAFTVKAVAGKAGYGDSGVASFSYSIAPANVQVVADNFAAYFDAALEDQGNVSDNTQQPILDKFRTGGKWTPAIAPYTYPSTFGGDQNSFRPGYFATVGVDSASGTACSALAGKCAVSSKNRTAAAAYSGRAGFADAQWAQARVPVFPTWAAVAGALVNAQPSYPLAGYAAACQQGVAGSGGSVTIYKYTAGTPATLATTAYTVSQGDTCRLEHLGSALRVLVNSAVAASATDASPLTGGTVGIFGNIASDFAGGNIGQSDATYAVGYSSTLPDYSQTLTSAWTSDYPWTYRGSSDGGAWYSGLAAYQNPNGLWGMAATNNGNIANWEFRGEFGSDQWEQAGITLNTANDLFTHAFLILQTRGAMWDNAACLAFYGTTQAPCYDYIGYYVGMEPLNGWRKNRGWSGYCKSKLEYICTPFLHATKVTPASSPLNKVVTVAAGGAGTGAVGQDYTPMQGDTIRAEYVAGRLRAYCKGATGAKQTWTANTAVPANTLIVDSYGDYQFTFAGGTTGASPPAWSAGWGAYLPAPAVASSLHAGAAYAYAYSAYSDPANIAAGKDNLSWLGTSLTTEISNGPASLSGSSYVTVTTPAVAASQTCVVWRLDPATGAGVYIVGQVACGGSVNDTGSAASLSQQPPVNPNAAAWNGQYTADGTTVWRYYGTACPSAGSWSMVMDVADGDLLNASGYPGVFTSGDTQSSSFYGYFGDWAAGTVKNGGLCTSLPSGCEGAQPVVNIITENAGPRAQRGASH